MTEHTDNTSNSDDELLSAYIDGELPDDKADILTERLAREPALMQRLEALRSTTSDARRLFESIDDLPMPQGVLDLLQEPKAPAPRDNVISFPQRMAQQFLQAPVAIAASLALAAGFLVDRMLVNEPPVAQGSAALFAKGIESGSDVHNLLENGLSTSPVELQDGSEARLLLTFQDQGGDWCRQFSVAKTSRELQALACRRNGQWQAEALAWGATPGGEFQQASGSTPAAINAAIDSAIADNEPLDADAEARLIQDGWKKTSH